MNYLLDTNVISELTARQPNPALIAWIQAQDETCLYLSALTIGEIQKGIAKLPDSARKQALDRWLRQDILERFQGRIVSVDVPVMLTWGTLTAELEKTGRVLPAINSLIAALALHSGLTLVARNTADFEGMPIVVLNPWRG